MKKLRTISADEYYYLTDPNWLIGIDSESDELDTRFGIMFHVLDMYEATGDEKFSEYPYIVEADIVLDGDPSTMINTLDYMGGVPIIHILQKQLKHEGKLFPVKGARHTVEHYGFGAVAAQEGKGAEFDSFQFKDCDDAVEFIKKLTPACEILGIMSGFFLDRPLNLVGEDGWTHLREFKKAMSGEVLF